MGEFVTVAGAFSAALAAVGGVFAAIVKFVVMPNMNDWWDVKAQPIFDKIERDLTVNGNSVNHVLAGLVEHLRELDQYQHKRNHDIINQNAAILGWIKLLHREDIAKMSPEMAAKMEHILHDRRGWNEGPPMGKPERRET